AFTRGLGVDQQEYKTVIGWKDTRPLPDGNFAEALLKNRGVNHNLAMCLRASGKLGLDIDGPEGAALVRQLIPAGLPPTVAVRSGRADGGLHLWYELPADAPKAKIQFAKTGLMLSGDGYFIVPPSWHSGAQRRYAFVEGHAPWEIPIAEFPRRLL